MQNTNAKPSAAPCSAFTRRICVSAMLICIGVLLPQLFHVFGPAAGKALLPMHIPVFICGMVCGWQYGAAVGLVTPLISSLTFVMPVMFPTGVSMCAELCTYGAVCGLMFCRLFKKAPFPARIYGSMAVAMLAGRAVSGCAKWLLLAGTESPLTWKAFIGAAFITAWPGILLQLMLIPAVLLILKKTKIQFPI